MARNMTAKLADYRFSCTRSFAKMGRSLHNLWNIRSTRMGLIGLPFAVIVVMILYSWSQQSHSFAMNGFLCLLVFDIVALIGDLLTRSYTYGGKPSIAFSFGYARFEVLTHFSILSLGLFLNLWSLKIFITLALFNGDNEEIHTGRFLPSVVLGSAAHFAICFGNNMLNKLSKIFCVTTTLQRCAYRVFNSFGLSIPSPSTSLLTPFTTLGVFSAAVIIVLTFTLQSGSRYIDFVGGVFIITAIFDAIWPLFKHTAQILLQTIPPHIASQLDKVLRQSLTVDGVLEFRNELFWTVSYGHIAGTLHVRVRRDAAEQVILVKLHDKLQTLAPHLTIQVTKDDFSRNFGNLHIICDTPRPAYITKLNVMDISPIQRIDGNAVNRMIYSTSSEQLLNSVSSNHSFTLDSSSVFKPDTALGISSNFNNDKVTSQNNFTVNRNAAHSRSASLDDTRRNPFIVTSNSSPAGSQPNILISSANYFGDE